MKYLFLLIVTVGLTCLPIAVSAQESGECGYCREEFMGGEIHHKMDAIGVIVSFCHKGQDPALCDEDGHDWDEGECDLHVDCSLDASNLRKLIEEENLPAVLEFLEHRADRVVLNTSTGTADIENCRDADDVVSVTLPAWVTEALS